MKVLFLDFDGVILHLRTLIASEWLGHSAAAPDPLLCALIRRACAQGVVLVISSSWRDAEATCKAKLVEAGLIDFLHADWRTPGYTSETGSRPREISDWLAAHPEVTDYRIADDDAFEWAPEQDSKWLICDSHDGMSAKYMRKLAEWAGVTRQKRH